MKSLPDTASGTAINVGNGDVFGSMYDVNTISTSGYGAISNSNVFRQSYLNTICSQAVLRSCHLHVTDGYIAGVADVDMRESGID